MSKWWKRAVLVLAAVGVVGAGAVIAGLQLAQQRMNRTVAVHVQPLAWRTDAAAIDRGKYLYTSRGCTDCHGLDGGGRMFLDDGGLRIRGPQIAAGAANVTADYQPADWVRAIRHGVHRSGRPLMVMPSEDYNRFTDEDLGALVGYIRTMPTVAGGPGIVDLPLPVRVAYGFGAIRDAAAKIDHSLPPAQPVGEGVTVEHGRYVANMCLGCHGPQLAGGRVPGGPPDWPPAARLAPGEGSVMPKYATAEALIALFRTGKRADGSAVKVMPFESLRNVSEIDLRALHLYLTSLK